MEDLPWFVRAFASQGRSHFFEVDGFRLHYLTWGWEDADKPVLLLIHGFRAHAHWWDFIAPYFTERYRVVALDLTGMGDSDWRPSYDLECFVRDIVGLIEHENIAPVTAVAHSFGGTRLLRAAADHPALFKHIVVIDSYVHFPALEGDLPAGIDFAATKIYPDFENARSRFRLSPPQPVELTELLDHVAAHSLKQVDGGWRWKFDPNLHSSVGLELDGPALLARITAAVDVIVGDRSAVVSVERAQRCMPHLRRGRGAIVVPQAAHHVMFDQPLALIGILRALLA